MRRIPVKAAVLHHEGLWEVYRQHLPKCPLRRVCELGPGDSLGMAVIFASAGAQQVYFVDRFEIRPAPFEDEIFEMLCQRHSTELQPIHSSRDRIRSLIKLRDRVRAEEFFTGFETFDFICSNAVLEHLDDPIQTLTNMYASLAPGGSMVHVVDLRNHGLFQFAGPLVWLETPPVVHKRLRKHTAKPNRVLFDSYREWAKGLPEVSFLVRHLIDSDHDFNGCSLSELPAAAMQHACARVRVQQHRFAFPINRASAEDLAVSAFILVVRKPAAE